MGVIIPIVQMMKYSQLLAGSRTMISLAPKFVTGIKKSEVTSSQEDLRTYHIWPWLWKTIYKFPKAAIVIYYLP